MGYFVQNKEIAKITKKPAKVSLANNPNYIQLESNIEVNEESFVPVDITIAIVGTGFTIIPPASGIEATYQNNSRFCIRETATNVPHSFSGIIALQNGAAEPNVDDYTYHLSTDLSQNAENLKAALMDCPFLRDNFIISVSSEVIPGGTIEMGRAIRIKSIGAGIRYAFKIEADDTSLLEKYIKVEGNPENTAYIDSINDSKSDCEIHLAMQRDTDVFLGKGDLPSETNMGVFAADLSKMYFHKPVWFDVNTLSQKSYSEAFLNSDKMNKWYDAGTASDIRFIAHRVRETASEAFYFSPVLYTITGYDRTLENNDLKDYVYAPEQQGNVKPLTRQPILNHAKGQTQYFNFILSDPNHDNVGGTVHMLGLEYELLTQSGQLIHKSKPMQEESQMNMAIVNTIKLDIDSFLKQYDNVGIVKVRLTQNGKAKSEPLIFNILPDYLFPINDFAFLNGLGGWSSFNFAGTDQMDFKSSTNLIHRTQTPDSYISSSIEAMHSKDVEERFTVETMPITHEVADWLKEMSSSVAVYELSTGRYVVVDDMTVKHTSKEYLVRVEMKFHYSDVYNGVVK